MSKPFLSYETRCPIHGSIEFSEAEKRIIDHPFPQRLRQISQLGWASYVYLGATHSRLGHSLGVMHLAGRIFDHLVHQEESRLNQLFHTVDLAYFRHILRIAALLHDVGHAPFSHAAESSLPLRQHLALPQAWYHTWDEAGQATHEDFSVAIVYALSQESPALLNIDEAQDICALIDEKIEVSPTFKQRCQFHQGQERNLYPLLKHLIGGEIDADRMDYLHRDSYYAGVNYGKFDLDRMIRSLSCTQTEQGIVLVLDHDAIYTYEDFLLARLHMFLQVYFHKTLLPFDYYLQRALEEGEIPCRLDGSLENFLWTRDDTVSAALIQAREKPWASRIVYRRPAKRLFQFEHYHPAELQTQVQQLLEREGIESLFLHSKRYFSLFSPGHTKPHDSLLVKNKILGRVQYWPVQKVSLVLERYHRHADIQILYCERADYEHARDVLTPLLCGNI